MIWGKDTSTVLFALSIQAGDTSHFQHRKILGCWSDILHGLANLPLSLPAGRRCRGMFPPCLFCFVFLDLDFFCLFTFLNFGFNSSITLRNPSRALPHPGPWRHGQNWWQCGCHPGRHFLVWISIFDGPLSFWKKTRVDPTMEDAAAVDPPMSDLRCQNLERPNQRWFIFSFLYFRSQFWFAELIYQWPATLLLNLQPWTSCQSHALA